MSFALLAAPVEHVPPAVIQRAAQATPNAAARERALLVDPATGVDGRRATQRFAVGSGLACSMERAWSGAVSKQISMSWSVAERLSNLDQIAWSTDSHKMTKTRTNTAKIVQYFSPT